MTPPELPPGFEIRNLTLNRDRDKVRTLYDLAADYVRLETGRKPDKAIVKNFFISRPPGSDLANSFKLGMFSPHGDLIAIADLGFDFPEPKDAYLGLMLFDPAFRGQGLGPGFLAHIIKLAKTRGAPNLYLAVLDENHRGRTFWRRLGFRHALTASPTDIGDKSHIRHRLVYPL